MKLKIGQALDNNSVRLDYVKTSGSPIDMPSYIIDKNLLIANKKQHILQ